MILLFGKEKLYEIKKEQMCSISELDENMTNFLLKSSLISPITSKIISGRYIQITGKTTRAILMKKLREKRVLIQLSLRKSRKLKDKVSREFL